MGGDTSWKYFQFSRENGEFFSKVSNDGNKWVLTKFDPTNVTTEDVYFVFKSLNDDRSITYKNFNVYDMN
jgi:hypothetical protein